jgi:hypothetical protein
MLLHQVVLKQLFHLKTKTLKVTKDHFVKTTLKNTNGTSTKQAFLNPN